MTVEFFGAGHPPIFFFKIIVSVLQRYYGHILVYTLLLDQWCIFGSPFLQLKLCMSAYVWLCEREGGGDRGWYFYILIKIML